MRAVDELSPCEVGVGRAGLARSDCGAVIGVEVLQERSFTKTFVLKEFWPIHAKRVANLCNHMSGSIAVLWFPTETGSIKTARHLTSNFHSSTPDLVIIRTEIIFFVLP